ncbi:MAG: hypothetical protein AAF744_12570 [Pseudomonadota bacterium]
MKQTLVSILALTLLTGAATAQEDRGLTLMERGAQLFMEGILKEMEPALEEFEGLADDIGPALRGFAQEMGPALRSLLEEVEDWSAYEAPEILPNGDIIIRRKPDRPLEENDDPGEPIEL